MPTLAFTCAFPDPAAFLAAFDAELRKGGLLVRGASAGPSSAMSACELTVTVGAHPPLIVPARVAAVVPGVGVAVMFEGTPPALQALAERLRSTSLEPASPTSPTAGPPPGASAPSDEAPADDAPSEPGPPALVSERLKLLTAPQKMSLAVHGSRDERAALLRDVNKVLHVYVLKNPRLGLDEVLTAAKMPSLSPDALKTIAESREWTSSPGVLNALVRNPRTPLPIAVQLVERLGMSEVRALAKGGAREQVVHAARRRLNG